MNTNKTQAFAYCRSKWNSITHHKTRT